MSRSDFFGGLQQLLQGLQHGAGAGAQQVGAAAGAQQEGAAAGAQAAGAGAAQAGAQAAGAAQVGAQAAGAAQVGAAEQQLGAGAQQLARLPNRPASALFKLAKHTRAAVIQANFISKLLDIQAVGNVRSTPSHRRTPRSSGWPQTGRPWLHCPRFRMRKPGKTRKDEMILETGNSGLELADRSVFLSPSTNSARKPENSLMDPHRTARRRLSCPTSVLNNRYTLVSVAYLPTSR